MEDSTPLFWMIAAVGGMLLGGLLVAAVDGVGYQQQLCQQLFDQQVCQTIATLLEL